MLDYKAQAPEGFDWTFGDEIIPELKTLAKLPALGGGVAEGEQNSGNTKRANQLVDFGSFYESQVTFASDTSSLQWFDIEQVLPEIEGAYEEGHISKQKRDEYARNWFKVWQIINQKGVSDFQHWVNNTPDSDIEGKITASSPTASRVPAYALLGLAVVVAVVLWRVMRN